MTYPPGPCINRHINGLCGDQCGHGTFDRITHAGIDCPMLSSDVDRSNNTLAWVELPSSNDVPSNSCCMRMTLPPLVLFVSSSMIPHTKKAVLSGGYVVAKRSPCLWPLFLLLLSYTITSDCGGTYHQGFGGNSIIKSFNRKTTRLLIWWFNSYSPLTAFLSAIFLRVSCWAAFMLCW